MRSWIWRCVLLGLLLGPFLGGGGRAAQADESPLPPAPPVEAAPGTEDSAAPALAGSPSTEDAETLAPEPALLALRLVDAVRMALESNLTLAAARYDEPIAFQRWVAADAAFDPLLTAGFEVSRNETPSTFSFTGSQNLEEDRATGQVGWERALRRGGRVSLLYRADRLDSNSAVAAVNPAWTQALELEVVRPLLRGAGDVVLSDLRRAHNGIEQARHALGADVEALLLQVVEAYWELAYSDALIEARAQSVRVAETLLTDTEARLDAKSATTLDVAEARAGVERRRSELLDAQLQRSRVQDALLALIHPFRPGRIHGRAVQLLDRLEDVPARVPGLRDVETYVRMAWQGRHELRAGEAEIANRGLDVLEAHDAIRPSLDVTGRIGTQGLEDGIGRSLEDALTGQALSVGVGFQFRHALGQRAARSAWRVAAWARRQARIRQRERQNQVVVQVRDALRSLDTAQAQHRAAQAEVAAAVEGEAGERDKLAEGHSTPFAVLQREDDVREARTRLGRAQADLRTGRARLWRAVGHLAHNLGVAVPRWGACPAPRGRRR